MILLFKYPDWSLRRRLALSASPVQMRWREDNDEGEVVSSSGGRPRGRLLRQRGHKDHRLRHDNEAGYMGPQGLQRGITAHSPERRWDARVGYVSERETAPGVIG